MRSLGFMLRAILTILGKVPSRGYYALIYLGLIPAFALVYSMFPHGFYHSTIKYENAISGAKTELETMLKNEIVRAFTDYYHTDNYVENDWRYDLNFMNVSIREVSL